MSQLTFWVTVVFFVWANFCLVRRSFALINEDKGEGQSTEEEVAHGSYKTAGRTWEQQRNKDGLKGRLSNNSYERYLAEDNQELLAKTINKNHDGDWKNRTLQVIIEERDKQLDADRKSVLRLMHVKKPSRELDALLKFFKDHTEYGDFSDFIRSNSFRDFAGNANVEDTGNYVNADWTKFAEEATNTLATLEKFESLLRDYSKNQNFPEFNQIDTFKDFAKKVNLKNIEDHTNKDWTQHVKDVTNSLKKLKKRENLSEDHTTNENSKDFIQIDDDFEDVVENVNFKDFGDYANIDRTLHAQYAASMPDNLEKQEKQSQSLMEDHIKSRVLQDFTSIDSMKDFVNLKNLESHANIDWTNYAQNVINALKKLKMEGHLLRDHMKHRILHDSKQVDNISDFAKNVNLKNFGITSTVKNFQKNMEWMQYAQNATDALDQLIKRGRFLKEHMKSRFLQDSTRFHDFKDFAQYVNLKNFEDYANTFWTKYVQDAANVLTKLKKLGTLLEGNTKSKNFQDHTQIDGLKNFVEDVKATNSGDYLNIDWTKFAQDAINVPGKLRKQGNDTQELSEEYTTNENFQDFEHTDNFKNFAENVNIEDTEDYENIDWPKYAHDATNARAKLEKLGAGSQENLSEDHAKNGSFDDLTQIDDDFDDVVENVNFIDFGDYAHIDEALRAQDSASALDNSGKQESLSEDHRGRRVLHDSTKSDGPKVFVENVNLKEFDDYVNIDWAKHAQDVINAVENLKKQESLLEDHTKNENFQDFAQNDDFDEILENISFEDSEDYADIDGTQYAQNAIDTRDNLKNQNNSLGDYTTNKNFEDYIQIDDLKDSAKNITLKDSEDYTNINWKQHAQDAIDALENLKKQEKLLADYTKSENIRKFTLVDGVEDFAKNLNLEDAGDYTNTASTQHGQDATNIPDNLEKQEIPLEGNTKSRVLEDFTQIGSFKDLVKNFNLKDFVGNAKTFWFKYAQDAISKLEKLKKPDSLLGDRVKNRILRNSTHTHNFKNCAGSANSEDTETNCTSRHFSRNMNRTRYAPNASEALYDSIKRKEDKRRLINFGLLKDHAQKLATEQFQNVTQSLLSKISKGLERGLTKKSPARVANAAVRLGPSRQAVREATTFVENINQTRNLEKSVVSQFGANLVDQLLAEHSIAKLPLKKELGEKLYNVADLVVPSLSEKSNSNSFKQKPSKANAQSKHSKEVPVEEHPENSKITEKSEHSVLDKSSNELKSLADAFISRLNRNLVYDTSNNTRAA